MVQTYFQTTYLTAMVGRETEIQHLRHLLSRPETRLITLTGAGGVGKTRLSIETGESLREQFPDGVYFVSLAETTNPAEVSADISHSLRIDEKVGELPLSQLAFYFQERCALLVLDNFEQVLAAAAQIAELLIAAPHLKILVTSREPLHLSGEQEYPVPPLTLPDLELHRTPVALLQSEAVALFVARAQAANPRFQLTEQNALTVGQICLYLDGLPLALELAAARVKFFSPEQLLQRLRHRLGLLVGGARDLPSRQQTLRGTIDWSYGLLTEREKRLFAKLGVFTGGFTLEAAESICCNDLDSTLVEDLSSLVDKSMVQRYDDLAGGARFRLLETMREYALERLGKNHDHEPVRQRHTAYYLDLAENAAHQLFSREQAQWLRRIEVEHNNIVSALEWSEERGDADTLARLSIAVGDYWQRRVCIREGTYWSALALRLPDIAPDSRAHLLIQNAEVAIWRGEFTQAQAGFEEGLNHYRATHNPTGQAEALLGLGDVALRQNRKSAAWDYYSQGLVIGRETGHLTQTSRALRSLAEIQRDEGNFAEARALLEEALPLANELGDDYMTAFVLHELGYILLKQGEYHAAFDVQMRCLRLRTELNNRSAIIHSLEVVAWTICEMGLYEPAAQLFGAMQRLVETIDPLMRGYKSQHDHYVEKTRQRLNAETFAAAWDAGYAMPFEAIVEWVDELPCELNIPEANPLERYDLTPREAEVLRLLATGLTDREIAERLVISPRTVNTHLTSVYGKLGVSSRSAATRFALENRLFDDTSFYSA
jgi:predicted ATPase/DNA-binding CsgD family transcriptional regulator